MEKAGAIKLAVNVMCLAMICLANAIESPQYTVVHLESDFEVRLYRSTVWMSATARELSFQKATLNGFHRLFQYIQGANLNFSRIPMTAPVLTSIVSDAGPLHSPAYSVSLYLPVKFQADPPVPLPELKLKPINWNSTYVAVRKFSGFAMDENVVREAEKLAISLSRTQWANSTSSESPLAYSVAQYDSPFQLIGRTNEVWVEVNATSKLVGVAAY